MRILAWFLNKKYAVIGNNTMAVWAKTKNTCKEVHDETIQSVR